MTLTNIEYSLKTGVNIRELIQWLQIEYVKYPILPIEVVHRKLYELPIHEIEEFNHD